MTEPRLESWCRLDDNDRILGLDANIEGAGAEQGLKLDAAAYVGSRIYDHVAGHFTRRFLKEFFDRARKSGGEARSTYRCDAPQKKVLMEMRAEMEPAGTLFVSHWHLGETVLPFPIEVRETAGATIPSLMRCSICNRVKAFADAEGKWQEPECDAKPGETLLVVHTVCLDCRKGVSLRRRWDILYPGGNPLGEA